MEHLQAFMLMPSVRKWGEVPLSASAVEKSMWHVYTHIYLLFFQNRKLFIARSNLGLTLSNMLFSVWNHPLTSLSIVFQLKMCSCDKGLFCFMRNETKNTLHPDGLSTGQKTGPYSIDINSSVLKEIGCWEQLQNMSDPALSLADVAC